LLADGLLARDLLIRQSCDNDRRRIAMKLTAKGEESLDHAINATLKSLTNRISLLCPEDIETVSQALIILKGAFPEAEMTVERKECTKNIATK
jgi:DNA-binding MarR family transcriptional regulator